MALPCLMALVAVVLWAGPFRHVGLWTHAIITDIPVYQASSDATARGELPYLDVPLEYPPLAAAVFWVARFMPGDYATGFTALMMLAWAAATAGATYAAIRMGHGRMRQLAVGLAMAATPLLLGGLVATRFDAVVTALMAWLVAAAVTERWRLMWTLLAAAVLVKLVPILLVPVLLIWHAHRASGREAARAGGAALAGVAAVFGAIAAVAPDGLWDMFAYHLHRPVQVESTAASYMLALHALADVPLGVGSSYGSQGLTGQGPGPIAVVVQVVAFVLMVAVAVVLRRALPPLRRGPDARFMVAALATTVVLIVAGSKVFSPQFMMWLLPAALLAGGPYGALAAGLTVAALVATHVYFPRQYWDLVALHKDVIWFLVVRNALVLGLVAACWPRPWAFRHRPAVTLRSSGNVSAAAEHAPRARYLAD